MNRDERECLLDRLLELWLAEPDELRSEVRMFDFAFSHAANPAYRFDSPSNMYRVIRRHLYVHGRITGTIEEEF